MRHLAPGISYTQEITSGNAPLVINVLRMDLKTAGVHLQMGQARDVVSINGPFQGREVIHSLAARHHALAAINADFFPFTGDPLGIDITDGEFISEPPGNRACFGITHHNEIVISVLAARGFFTTTDGSKLTLGGINRVPHKGDTLVLTPTFKATPRADSSGSILVLRDVDLPVKLSKPRHGIIDSISPIAAGEQIPQTLSNTVQIISLGTPANSLPLHCKRGDSIAFQFDLVADRSPLVQGHSVQGHKLTATPSFRLERNRPLWQNVTQAVGGGPMLLKDGNIAVDGEAEGFSKSDFIDKRHPRSAIGVDDKGHLLLVTVDGHTKWSQGASLLEMAAILKRLGAVQAMNLDGGGSTTMVIDDLVVNAPSDGRERPVADGLLVYSDTPVKSSASSYSIAINQAICPESILVHAGVPIHFQLLDAKNRLVDPFKIIWGTEEGLGFVSQAGIFTCLHQGKGTVAAHIKDKRVRITVQVVGTSSVPASSASQQDPDQPLNQPLIRHSDP